MALCDFFTAETRPGDILSAAVLIITFSLVRRLAPPPSYASLSFNFATWIVHLSPHEAWEPHADSKEYIAYIHRELCPLQHKLAVVEHCIPDKHA